MPRPSLLDVPDRLAEHGREQAHSPTIAHVLVRVYERLAAGEYDEAERLMFPYRGWPMAETQHARALFIQASAACKRQHYRSVIECCDEALALCYAREWRVEFAQLALLCAEAHHNLQLFTPAAELAGAGLDAWLSVGPSDDTRDLALEIDLRDRLSVELFLLGRFADALQHTRLARRLTHALPASRSAALRAAGLGWTNALVQRWRGDAHGARRQILAILPTYEHLGSPDELARLRIVVADIALDALAPLGRGIVHHYRDDIVHLAQRNLSLARETIDARGVDPAARAMALLAQMRLGRTLGTNEDRFPLLESIGRLAEQWHDLPLLGQVYTALGDEFGAAGRTEVESQLSCYRRALGVIEGSHTPAYGVWARRGLHEAAARE